MNVYCHVCKKEMEIMQDLISEISVFPCGCAATDLQTLTARAEQAEAERNELKKAMYEFLAMPISTIEEAQAILNDNTRIILEARQAVIDKLKGGEA